MVLPFIETCGLPANWIFTPIWIMVQKMIFFAKARTNEETIEFQSQQSMSSDQQNLENIIS